MTPCLHHKYLTRKQNTRKIGNRMAGLRLRSSAETNKVLELDPARKRALSTSDKVSKTDSVITRCLSLFGITSKKEEKDHTLLSDEADGTIKILSVIEKERFLDGSTSPNPNLVDFSSLNCFGGQHVVEPDIQNDIINYAISRQISYPEDLRSLWIKHFGEDGEKIYGKVVAFVYYACHSKPVPTECSYLAIYYINFLIQSCVPALEDFEAVILAAVNLAAKVERQQGISRSFFGNVDRTVVCTYEREIMWSVEDFNLVPTTLPQIRRLYTIQLNKEKWSHVFSKFLCDVSQFNLYLVQIPDTLLGAVIMRLLANMQNEELWDSNCYSISLHHEPEFAVPHTVLCRLVLTAQANASFYTIFQSNSSLYKSLINAHRQLLIIGATSAELAPEITVYKWNDDYLST